MSRREHRFPMMLNQDEVSALDDWRFANRIPTRSRAARTLIERGLVADELLDALRGALEWMRCVTPELQDGTTFKRDLEDYAAAIAKAEGL